jgi:hypothetical protein
MENLQSTQPITWVKVIVPGTGEVYYTPLEGSATLQNTTTSLAITASYALNGGGGSDPIDTGSLLITASFGNPRLTFTKGDGNAFTVDLSSLTSTSASYASTASIVPSYEGAWIPYTPSWTAASVNPVIGNGTIEGYYKVIGKTCFVRGNIAMGSTTTFGSGEWYVSMPFTASHADAILMTAQLLDNGSAWYNATLNGARAGFNFKTAIQYQSTGGTALDVNATQPFTWANSDRFLWNGSFEIA